MLDARQEAPNQAANHAAEGCSVGCERCRSQGTTYDGGPYLTGGAIALHDQAWPGGFPKIHQMGDDGRALASSLGRSLLAQLRH